MSGVHLMVLSRKCVLLEPNISLNPARPEDYALDIIHFIQKNHTQGLIYDLKNIALIDQTYYQWLSYLYTLCKINNACFVVVHMQPSAAYGLSRIINEPPPFKSALSIENARELFF